MPNGTHGDEGIVLEVGVSGQTRRRTVTESDVVGFAGLSGDWHPLHTDDVYATQGPFKRRIAHGFLVLSIASGLLSIGSSAPLNNHVRAFYGLERLRFIQPVFLGDSISVSWEVVKRQDRGEKPDLAHVSSKILNQHGAVVALFEMLLVVDKVAIPQT